MAGGGKSGLRPAYCGISGPTWKAGSRRGPGQHEDLGRRARNQAELIWTRGDLRTTSLRPVGAKRRVCGPCVAVMTGGRIGTQSSAQGQGALLSARELGQQGGPRPWLAHGVLLVFMRCLGEQVMGPSQALKLGIVASMTLSLPGGYPLPINNHNKQH